ncbi:MAG: hypothetical protein OXT67_09770 [Zetaproteobacteria bacterium]|nr:hypothetical protein [Zetaproteobacteria bacterium]
MSGTVRQMTAGQAKDLALTLGGFALTDLTYEQAQQLLSSKGELGDAVRAAQHGIIGGGQSSEQIITPKPLDQRVYRIIVDCTVSDDPVERFKMLRDAGGYDWTSDLVKDKQAHHWAIAQSDCQERELVLVHLDRTASSEDVLRYMRQHDLKRPTVADGLAFGAQHGHLQCQFPIVVLSEQMPVFDGRQRLLALNRYGDCRGLYVSYFDDNWRRYYRFLACK